MSTREMYRLADHFKSLAFWFVLPGLTGAMIHWLEAKKSGIESRIMVQ